MGGEPGGGGVGEVALDLNGLVLWGYEGRFNVGEGFDGGHLGLGR